MWTLGIESVGSGPAKSGIQDCRVQSPESGDVHAKSEWAITVTDNDGSPLWRNNFLFVPGVLTRWVEEHKILMTI